MSSSVHHSGGTKPPPCVMYALKDLIETENVMFHSGALLIGWLSITRLVRQLQTRAMSLDESQSGGLSVVGVSGCVCLYWGARPAGSNAGAGWGLTDSLIIDVFFGFAFMFHTVLPGWGNRALADQTRRSASLAQLEGLQSETTGRQVRAAKVVSLSNSLRGWNLGRFHLHLGENCLKYWLI